MSPFPLSDSKIRKIIVEAARLCRTWENNLNQLKMLPAFSSTGTGMHISQNERSRWRIEKDFRP